MVIDVIQRFPVLSVLVFLASAILVFSSLMYRVKVYVEGIERLDPELRRSHRSVKEHTNINEDRFDNDDVRLLYEKLRDWVCSENPDFLVGMHMSGLMLAAKIASDLGYAKSRVAYYSTAKLASIDPEINFYGANEGLTGKICVVDDVTRSGKTMEQVSKKIFSDYQLGFNRVNDALFGVIITVRSQSKVQSGYFDPHFTVLETSNQNISLPWTKMVLQIRDQIDQKREGRNFNRQMVSFYNRAFKELSFATFCMDFLLRAPERFYELFEQEQLYSHFKQQTSDPTRSSKVRGKIFEHD